MDKNFWLLTGEEPVNDMLKINEIFKEHLEMYKDNKNILSHLKAAYQAAMDEVFENDIKPRLDLVIKEIDGIYSDIATRFNTELWESVLNNKLLENKFVYGYVRNEIIAYLLYHEYVSMAVWQVIDKKLNIIRDYDEIKEIFPITFLQRVKKVLNDETLFEYERISALNECEKNPDEYIQNLFEMADMIEFDGSEEEIQEQIKKLKNYAFHHICYDAEYLNYLVKFEKTEEEIAFICNKLKNEENIYVQACVADALWYLEKSEEADEIWQRILEVIPDYYKALIGHAKYLFENEYYDQAKDYVFFAIESAGERDEALKLLSDINDVVMKHHLDMYEENPDNLYDGIQYAWCLCQSGRWDEAIEFLLDMEEDENVSYDINMLLGRAYFSKDDFENAIPYLQKWIKQTMLLPCDGSDDYKEKMERYPGALAIMGECCRETGNIDKAIYFMEQSMHAYDDNDEDKLKAMTRLADFYNEAGRYKEAFELSEKVIQRDDGYVWAYFAHQIAAFETYNTTAVVRDYSALTNFSPGSVEPYIYAAKVYMFNNMYEDMELVIERAESNGVSAPQFEIMKYIIAAGRAEICDLLDVEENFDSLCARNHSLRDETNLVVRFYMTIEGKYRNAGRYEDAIEYIDRIISLEPENVYHKWEKADLYFHNNEDENSLEIYKSISAELKDNSNFLCDYAFCMQYNEMWEESAAVLVEVLKMEDTGMADAYMMRYYKNLYNETDSREHYMLARKHIDRQIENMPDNMFSIQERMFLQMIAEDQEGLDTAIEDCNALIDAEYGNVIERRKQLADLYIKKGEPQKALEELENIMDRDVPCSPALSTYKIAAKAYVRMNRRDLAEKLLKSAYKKTKKPYFMKEIANACVGNGNYRSAIRWCKKFAVSDDENFKSSIALAEAFLLNKNKMSAERIYKKIFAHIGKKNELAVRCAAWQIFNYMFDAERAAEYMQKAAKYTERSDTDAYSALALFYRYMNNDKKAKEYSQKLFSVMTDKHDGSLEKYIDVTYGRRDKIDNVVLYYIGLGEFDKAEEYINKMHCGTEVCAWCSEPCCTDAYIRLAQLRIVQGDFEGMKKVCEELLSRDSNNPRARNYLENIEELKKQYENYR